MTTSGPGRIRLVSQTVAVDVDAPSGGRISSIRHLASGAEVLLSTPWADEEWAGSAAMTDSADEWHRRYPGGWHGLVPHAGSARTVDGVAQPFHGEAGWRAWSVVEHTSLNDVTLSVTLRTVPIEARRRITLDDNTLSVRQCLRNLSGEPVRVSYTEHPAFGPDLLGPGTVITVGAADDPVLRVSPSDPGVAFRTVRVPSGSARVSSPSNSLEVELTWDPAVFPYAHIWHELAETSGFPWWGQVRTMAVEPASRPDVPEGEALGPLLIPGEGELQTTVALTLRDLGTGCGSE
ncbi:hypothetical protein [Agreia sp. COWG]|uniref:hypothetical protein n=1 Tax=Agreia sp. COWG TaxID=2773266 RepID=UPI001925F03F|nr:hypothetical protein [Agreia sp. COWG]CAD6010611.1 Galactose mutarotase [Agreia sp. COWG]